VYIITKNHQKRSEEINKSGKIDKRKGQIEEGVVSERYALMAILSPLSAQV